MKKTQNNYNSASYTKHSTLFTLCQVYNHVLMTREEMTKQDYVQKYLEDILADAWRKGAHKKGIDVTEEADKARLHLTKWGVVIKVDREYPEEQLDVEYRYGDYPVEGYGREFCAQDKDALDKAGYVAVEPLIEEKVKV